MGNTRHCVLYVIVIIIACGVYGRGRDEEYVKTTYQRTSVSPIAITANSEGKFILLENTSSGPSRKAFKMDGWRLKRIVDGRGLDTYFFKNFVLKPGRSVKIYARGYASQAGLNDLVFRDIDSWGQGSRVDTVLWNEMGEEMARLTKKIAPN